MGLVIDNSFRYRDQINTYIRNAYIQLKKIYINRKDLSLNLKKQLCETFVLSQYNFCSPIYHPAIDVATSRRIQKIQNSCLRVIYGIRKFSRISHKLVDARWLSMYNRRELQSLLFHHKIFTSRRPEYLYNKIIFRFQIHDRSTRGRGNLQPPRHRLTMFERSFSYHIYKSYSLLNCLLDLTSAQSKRYIFQQLFSRQCSSN